MNLHAIASRLEPLQPHFLTVGIELSEIISRTFTRARGLTKWKKHDGGVNAKGYTYRLTTFVKRCGLCGVVSVLIGIIDQQSAVVV